MSISDGGIGLIPRTCSKPLDSLIAKIDGTFEKSHMGFQLVPKVVTLNDLEWHNGR